MNGPAALLREADRYHHPENVYGHTLCACREAWPCLTARLATALRESDERVEVLTQLLRTLVDEAQTSASDLARSDTWKMAAALVAPDPAPAATG